MVVQTKDEKKLVNPNLLTEDFNLNPNINLDELRWQIESLEVTLTKKEIKEYLYNLYKEEYKVNPDKDLDYKTGKLDYSNVTSSDIRKEAEYILDNIELAKYEFEPYTLEYFKKYLFASKNEILKLISILEKILNNDLDSIQEYLNQYRILVNDNKVDIKSLEILLAVLQDQIHTLNHVFNMANTPSTYKDYKVTEESDENKRIELIISTQIH